MYYYFAYGSNMNKAQMLKRCPSSKPIGVAVLKNYALAFTAYSNKRESAVADVVEKLESEVWGILYTLSETDVNSLDNFEGAPNFYKKINVSVLLQSNWNDEWMGTVKSFEAFTYAVVNKTKQTAPTNAYLKILIDAAIQHHFPEWYQQIINNFSRNI